MLIAVLDFIDSKFLYAFDPFHQMMYINGVW